MALPRIYSKPGVSAHHDGKTQLALDGPQLLKPPIQYGIVVDVGPRKFCCKQAGEIPEIVVCVGQIEEDDTAVWLCDQSHPKWSVLQILPSARCSSPPQ